eukprot:TRINITY_DN886_c0_g1_i2.p2 TRINITY_DN886_c0_g1~~TRINITY_DN886_c0_g1_i2.p2  ORF type:complete len:133 (-),score=7.39 TRINITY_DN886_c0_g1_i2:1978-2376(-)
MCLIKPQSSKCACCPCFCTCFGCKLKSSSKLLSAAAAAAAELAPWRTGKTLVCLAIAALRIAPRGGGRSARQRRSRHYLRAGFSPENGTKEGTCKGICKSQSYQQSTMSMHALAMAGVTLLSELYSVVSMGI